MTDLSVTDYEDDGSDLIKLGVSEQHELEDNLVEKENHDQLESGDASKFPFSRNIVETEELLQFRKENIAYFIASDGSPCDEGSRALIEVNKIPVKLTLQVCNISETKKSNNKYLYGLCIREKNPESQEVIMNNPRTTLTLLRESLLEKNLKEFSIAKSPYIENVAWQDVPELVKDIFQASPIKIIVCKGTLQYVMQTRRNF